MIFLTTNTSFVSRNCCHHNSNPIQSEHCLIRRLFSSANCHYFEHSLNWWGFQVVTTTLITISKQLFSLEPVRGSTLLRGKNNHITQVLGVFSIVMAINTHTRTFMLTNIYRTPFWRFYLHLPFAWNAYVSCLKGVSFQWNRVGL